jgi:hypothetical protein
MAMIRFTSNVTDHSTDKGYQFEFHCDKCGNGVMSSFVASKAGMAGGFLRAASSLFGGSALSGAANAADYLRDQTRGKARDEALARAVEEAKPHFRQCTRCGQWVCHEHCWNAAKGLCEACAPNLQEELAAAQATAASEQVWAKAREVDLVGGVDVRADAAATCGHCGAASTGGKFCPECGKPFRQHKHCTGCGAKLEAKAKFCAECGNKAA